MLEKLDCELWEKVFDDFGAVLDRNDIGQIIEGQTLPFYSEEDGEQLSAQMIGKLKDGRLFFVAVEYNQDFNFVYDGSPRAAVACSEAELWNAVRAFDLLTPRAAG